MKSGVGVWVWSDPVRLSCGNQIFTLPLPIGTEPTELAQLNRRDEVDGRIGWPEVRDNILVFDPRRHTVRRVEKLPAETAGWLKFKVHQDERFLIDLPLPNGKTGTVLVDTGDQGGVSLPLEQWIAWQAAHPQAAVSTHHYVGPETGSGTNEIAWADEFTLGGLTLTQVQIGEAPSAVGEGIVNYAGTLGMDVLERMDLVVDGPGGYAYLKPRPSSDQADSASARNAADYAIGNWSVDGNVRLRDGYIRALPYALRGLDKLKKGDADGAIADFTQALQFAPGDAYDVYSDRGNAKKDKGDFAGAVADYSRALEFDPANGSDYENQALARIALGDYDGAIADYTHLIKLFPEDFWYPFRRGVARQIQGDFQGALADYDRTVELNPNDSPHSRLNREVLRLRLGTAPVDFAENLSGWPDGWMKTIGQFVAGQLDATALLAVAGSGDSGPAKARRSVADYYIGISQLLKGDQAGAKASFQDSLAVGDKMTDEYQLSRAELAKLKDSSQP
jgi:tetratricopeptide (TPR) repeat protein